MSSKYYEVQVSITIDGDERDVFVRGFVETGWDVGCPNGFGAVLDGDPDVRVSEGWLSIDSVTLGEGDLARITEALENAALEDDSEFDGYDDFAEAAE